MIGRRLTTVCDNVNKHDGRRPLAPKPRSEKRLSVDEREKTSKLNDNPTLRTVVEAKLAEYWSPEQIAG